MPYKGTETLVFRSNTGDIDTIFFLKKDTSVAYPEAQSLNGKTYEVVGVFSRHSDPAPPDGKHRYLENYFIQLKKSKDNKARLDLIFSTKDAWFYRLEGPRIDSLDKIRPASLKTSRKTYYDIYVIDDIDWMNFKQRSNYVTKAYWSKSEGLIRFEKQDDVYWELTDKYTP
jgi:hypothetical protein